MFEETATGFGAVGAASLVGPNAPSPINTAGKIRIKRIEFPSELMIRDFRARRQSVSKTYLIDDSANSQGQDHRGRIFRVLARPPMAAAGRRMALAVPPDMLENGAAGKD